MGKQPEQRESPVPENGGVRDSPDKRSKRRLACRGVSGFVTFLVPWRYPCGKNKKADWSGSQEERKEVKTRARYTSGSRHHEMNSLKAHF